VCGGAGTPYPQYAVAFGAGSVWVACPRLEAVQRIDPETGRVVAQIAFPGVRMHTVTASDEAVWAIALPDSIGRRIDPATNRVAARVPFGVEAPYLWAAAGALWIADDSGRAIVRLDPATNRVVARYPVGDGPAGFATDGRSVWILNHRENSLDRIDIASGTVTRLASGLGPADNAAAERIALAAGSLWITGRGLDLMRVDPNTGAVLGRTEIGPAGIDVAASGGSVWVASYEAVAEPRGDPVLGALHRIDPATGTVVATSEPTAQTFADGFAVGGGHLWMVDSVHGLLLRL
jgi:streptogramin lyase